MVFVRKSFQRLLGTSLRPWLLQQHARGLVVHSVEPPTMTVKQARKDLKTVVGSSKTFSEGRDDSVIGMVLATSQAELPIRVMSDSFCEASIPLSSDLNLREKYINFHNTVRFGRIFEDLDTMAVWISYTHNRDPKKGLDQKSPLSIVTACVDRIDVTDEIQADHDVYIRGHVTHVGQTSLEVTMHVEQNDTGSIRDIMEAKFLMVARDPQNVSKAYVNPLSVTSTEEEVLFKEGEVNKNVRRQQAKESLLKIPPNEEERRLIHDLFLGTLNEKTATFRRPVKPENAVWMEDSILKNIIICHPEERNLYNKIFGGFLMRQALEIGWANACVYSKMRPFPIAVDDIMFKRPVPIGSLLYLSAQVVYTNGPHLQVKIHAEVVDPRTGIHETTNTFHMTFRTMKDVPQIMPKSYAEYMIYVDGKRHYDESIKKQVTQPAQPAS